MDASLAPEDNVWISFGELAAIALTSIRPRSLDGKHKKLKNEVNVVSLLKSELPVLKQLLHEKYHTCGGFIVHDSYEEAIKYVAQLESAGKNQASYSYSIDNQVQVQKLLNEVDDQNLISMVNSLKNIPTRYHRSRYNLKTSNMIKDTWSKLIVGSHRDVKIEFYPHQRTKQLSVVLTINGNEEKNEIVMLGAHLDSKNQGDLKGGRAPGADDNASGISLLTECLRVIIETNYKPNKTIQLVAFAAEEDGLIGSNEMAEDYSMRGIKVVGMLNLDMSGYKGSQKDIYFVQDFTNQPQNIFLEKLMDEYFIPTLTYGHSKCSYACSDHVSWYRMGFPASYADESSFEDRNKNMHTTSDTDVDQHHMKKFAQLSLAYLAELAKSSNEPYDKRL